MIEKPFTQICFKHFFNWKKTNSEFGYNWISSFLAGSIPKSARPTWKGKYGNSSFKIIQKAVFQRGFDNVNISTSHRLIFNSGRGFCQETQSLDKKQIITSTVDFLRVYMVDKSTDSHVIFDQTPLEIGPTTNETFDYKVFKLFYSVIAKQSLKK